MKLPSNPKQAALYSLIASLTLSGLIGIVTLLIGQFDDLQVKVLFSSLTISGGSILALACGAAFEKNIDRKASRVGIGFACVATALLLIGIWTDPSADEYWRTTGSVCVLSTAFALHSLLSIAKVAPRFAWIRPASVAAIAILTGLILVIIWLEPRGDLIIRLTGIASIAVTVLTVITPVLHYISALQRLEAPPSLAADEERDPAFTPVDFEPTVMNLAGKLAQIDEYWKPHVIAELNGQLVKLAKVKGAFDFHHHDREDEFFMVVEGQLRIEFRTGSITLGPGEATVVPRGVEHRPVADVETHILLFEPSTTLNTGNVDSERTIRELPRI